MARTPVPHYTRDQDNLLAIAEARDPDDFEALMRLEAGGFITADMALTAEGCDAAVAIRERRRQRAIERAAFGAGEN